MGKKIMSKEEEMRVQADCPHKKRKFVSYHDGPPAFGGALKYFEECADCGKIIKKYESADYESFLEAHISYVEGKIEKQEKKIVKLKGMLSRFQKG